MTLSDRMEALATARDERLDIFDKAVRLARLLKLDSDGRDVILAALETMEELGADDE